MNKNLKYFLLITVIIFTQSVRLFSQDIKAFENDTLKKDTLHFYYKLEKGDTLIYKVVALDSISFNFDPPLIKSREERIYIICDSVINKRFYITQVLASYNSKESKEKEKSDNNYHPWLGRKAFYSIDSLGNRYSFAVDDSTKGAIGSAGAFGPILFVPLKETGKAPDETWNNTIVLDLPENGNPVPLIRMMYLNHCKDIKDTLNSTNYQFEYISTGQGSVRLTVQDENLRLTNILNGHGRVFIDTARMVPVFLYSTQEQKLKYTGSSKQMAGYHYTNSEYTLERYAKMVILPKEKQPKKKKSKQ